MATRTPNRDEQVRIARTYQVNVMRTIQRLEEDLVNGAFSGDVHKVMRQFKIYVADAIHDACMATLTTKEEEESIAIFNQELANHEESEKHAVDISVIKKRNGARH